MVSTVPVGLFGGVDLVRIIGDLFLHRHIGIPVHDGGRAGVGFAGVSVGDAAVADGHRAGSGHGHNLDGSDLDGDIHLAHSSHLLLKEVCRTFAQYMLPDGGSDGSPIGRNSNTISNRERDQREGSIWD